MTDALLDALRAELEAVRRDLAVAGERLDVARKIAEHEELTAGLLVSRRNALRDLVRSYDAAATFAE